MSNILRLITGVIGLLAIGCTMDISNAAAITYTYDNLNRLPGVNYGNEAVISYTYDAARNRLTKTSFNTDPLIADTDNDGMNLKTAVSHR